METEQMRFSFAKNIYSAALLSTVEFIHCRLVSCQLYSNVSVSSPYPPYFYCLINSIHFSHIQFIHIYIPICKQLNTL